MKKIEERLAKYKAMVKSQGDFHVYASLYIQDVEDLLSRLRPSTALARPGPEEAAPVETVDTAVPKEITPETSKGKKNRGKNNYIGNL